MNTWFDFYCERHSFVLYSEFKTCNIVILHKILVTVVAHCKYTFLSNLWIKEITDRSGEKGIEMDAGMTTILPKG